MNPKFPNATPSAQTRNNDDWVKLSDTHFAWVHARLFNTVESNEAGEYRAEIRDPAGTVREVATWRFARSVTTVGIEEMGFSVVVPLFPNWEIRRLEVSATVGGASLMLAYHLLGVHAHPVRALPHGKLIVSSPVFTTLGGAAAFRQAADPNRPAWVYAKHAFSLGPGGTQTTTIQIRDPNLNVHTVQAFHHSRSALQTGTNSGTFPTTFLLPPGWEYNPAGANAVLEASL